MPSTLHDSGASSDYSLDEGPHAAAQLGRVHI
jgi:hypothetical protein